MPREEEGRSPQNGGLSREEEGQPARILSATTLREEEEGRRCNSIALGRRRGAIPYSVGDTLREEEGGCRLNPCPREEEGARDKKPCYFDAP